MRLLGPHWDYMVTDQSGNHERLAFVFDTRKIRFRHVAGEVVLPSTKNKQAIQLNRSPYLVAFQAADGSSSTICTVHIYYGDAKDTAPRQARRSPISRSSSPSGRRRTVKRSILLGDFNILNPEDPTAERIAGWGI